MTNDEGMTKPESAGDHEARFWSDGDVAVIREEPPEQPVYDLEERTARFGEAVIDFANSIPQNPVTSRIIAQLVGAGESFSKRERRGYHRARTAFQTRNDPFAHAFQRARVLVAKESRGSFEANCETTRKFLSIRWRLRFNPREMKSGPPGTGHSRPSFSTALHSAPQQASTL